MTSSVRRCTSEDKDTIWKILSYAYSVPDASRERFLERLDLIEKEFFLNEVDGVPVAIARVLEFEQNVRGILKSMGGIAMVASTPEYRRSGHNRDLMLTIFDDLRRNGFVISTLYPFKDTFYSNIGYVKMPPSRTLEFNPNMLVGIKVPDGYTAQREEGEEMLQLRKVLHNAMVLETHGAVMRSEERWTEMTKNFNLKAVVARNGKGEPEAIMIYSIKGYGEGHEWAETGQINIVEFTWISLEGRDSILNYLYKHSDQIIKVTMVISTRDQDFYHWLSNIHTPTLRSNIVSMARIIDVSKSMSDFPVNSPGVVLISVIDPQIEENNKIFEIREKDGLLSIKESAKQAKTTIRIEGLTSILYGTLNEAQLRRLDWLEGESPSGLFNWFPPAYPWLTEDF
ncbi:GNAT family N-acetyltransferase [Candidatus Thorarchaeota archaeon]|nr:MAG: GNAT family N-acetyltransferase [Candidatus Thorarchaeota archaeon]